MAGITTGYIFHIPFVPRRPITFKCKKKNKCFFFLPVIFLVFCRRALRALLLLYTILFWPYHNSPLKISTSCHLFEYNIMYRRTYMPYRLHGIILVSLGYLYFQFQTKLRELLDRRYQPSIHWTSNLFLFFANVFFPVHKLPEIKYI